MTVKEQRQREWAARVTNFKASGMTMPARCSANQVNLNQASLGRDGCELKLTER